MSWILTSTGRQFWPLIPNLDDVDIVDIAHSLGMLCRFNGHCRTFYSVAEHSVKVSQIVPPQHALWGLLHDAAEAYLSDLPRPIKHQIPQFRDVEDELLKQILQKFGLSWPMPKEVKEADDILLVTEFRDLMAPNSVFADFDVQPLAELIEDTLSPQDAKQAFLERFLELTEG